MAQNQESLSKNHLVPAWNQPLLLNFCWKNISKRIKFTESTIILEKKQSKTFLLSVSAMKFSNQPGITNTLTIFKSPHPNILASKNAANFTTKQEHCAI